jgi:hypothetical protein
MKYPINPYRQGDWLITYGKTQPDRVESISYQKDMSGVWCDMTFRNDPNTYYYPDRCKPVPITRDILLKNGFRASAGYSFICKDYNGQTVSIWLFEVDKPERDIRLLITGRHFVTLLRLQNCNYVHQLQHALMLLGIEKEIEL